MTAKISKSSPRSTDPAPFQKLNIPRTFVLGECFREPNPAYRATVRPLDIRTSFIPPDSFVPDEVRTKGPDEYRHSNRSRIQEFGKVCENENLSAVNIPRVGESCSVRFWETLLFGDSGQVVGEPGKGVLRSDDDPLEHIVISAFNDAG
jgi:hypothetical protein